MGVSCLRVNIDFRSRDVHRLCTSEKEMERRLGSEAAHRLKLRLTQAQAADCLADMATLPQVHCHELAGDRQGHLAIDLNEPHALIVLPSDDPIPYKPNGGLDWTQVTSLMVVELTS